MKQLSSQLAPKRGVKRQLQDLLEQQEERRDGNGELLPEAAIDTLDHVKRKANKRAKVESIMVRKSRLYRAVCMILFNGGQKCIFDFEMKGANH